MAAPKKSIRKEIQESILPTALVHQATQGLPPKDALAVQVILEVVNNRGKLDPGVVKELIAAVQEVAYLLNWEARPKSKVQVAEEALSGLVVDEAFV